MALKRTLPRLVTAALRGGAGKTFITVGLIAALSRRGMTVSAFKKGPDYIDAGWLGLAAGTDCHNLDRYLFDDRTAMRSFLTHSASSDIALVEGNRGLFDGVDADGSFSTAELSKTLDAPVILTMDCTKMTRTAAAVVLGCRTLDPETHLKGVILNRTAGARHERVLRESIEKATSVPVLGAIRKLPLKNFPQRHLGLLPWHEHPGARGFTEEAAKVVEECVDLDAVLSIARAASPLAIPEDPPSVRGPSTIKETVRIGVLKDSAFQFYYPENLDALRSLGAIPVEVSALSDSELPDLDALYIGGGFPETHAERLADNTPFKESLAHAVEAGLPVYAECGGLMYLSRNLIIDDKTFPMAGILPVDTVLRQKPQGHGYTRVEADKDNPFYPQGTVLTGHEFHYSVVSGLDEAPVDCVFRVLRGHGLDGMRDGMCVRNVLATYVHVHSLGEPLWARGIVDRARAYGRWKRGNRCIAVDAHRR